MSPNSSPSSPHLSLSSSPKQFSCCFSISGMMAESDGRGGTDTGDGDMLCAYWPRRSDRDGKRGRGYDGCVHCVRFIVVKQQFDCIIAPRCCPALQPGSSFADIFSIVFPTSSSCYHRRVSQAFHPWTNWLNLHPNSHLFQFQILQGVVPLIGHLSHNRAASMALKHLLNLNNFSPYPPILDHSLQVPQ